jgi:hypothetical protein
MSSISAGTSTGSALVSTGDTSGALQLQVNGTTPSVTLAANGSIGVGSTPAYGTSGQVLTSAGSAAAPTWTTLGSGALTLLSTVNASAASTVDMETTFSSTYDAYLIVCSGVTFTTNNTVFMALMKIGGSYVTSAYGYNVITSDEDTTADTVLTGRGGVAAATELRCAPNVGNSASASLNLTFRIYNPTSTTRQKMMDWTGSYISGSPNMRMCFGMGRNTGTGALTGVRLYPQSGTMSGNFRLYGLANS